VGNSGMDISSEMASHASTVIISSRSGNWIAPRTTMFGLPTDQLATRAAYSLPKSLLNFALESLVTIHHGDLGKLNLKPKHQFLEATPVIGGQIFSHIDSGKIRVKNNVKRFHQHSVEFEDGSEEEIDSVILCTGYIVENPFLDREIVGKEEPDSNRTRLYKHIFPTNCKNLAFIGLVQPNGSILPVSEIQARWASKVFSGQSELPDLKQMRDTADIDWANHLKKFVPRERTTIMVDAIEYMDMVAEQVGCKPDLWRLWRSDIKLAAMCTFGPCIAAQYRLFGKGKNELARSIIENSCSHLDLRKYVSYVAPSVTLLKH
jgi:dimethylaniline monooxygenase (N-oxide forming)